MGVRFYPQDTELLMTSKEGTEGQKTASGEAAAADASKGSSSEAGAANEE
jgi:hypothetical protein